MWEAALLLSLGSGPETFFLFSFQKANGPGVFPFIFVFPKTKRALWDVTEKKHIFVQRILKNNSIIKVCCHSLID